MYVSTDMQSQRPNAVKKRPPKRRVLVLREPEKLEPPSDEVNLCPLGLQFHVATPVEPFTVMAVDIDAPTASGRHRKVTCTGTVVRCQPGETSGTYRVWLQFLDVPAPAREHLRCTAKQGHLLCSYCANF